MNSLFKSALSLIPKDHPITLLIGLLLVSVNTFSDILIRFEESAPTDRFTIQNKGSCTLNALTLFLDVSSSVGKLLFDTTASGAGENVFQPFRIAEGQGVLSLAKEINDGDSQINLAITELKPSQVVSFTIDVDDTLTNSELRTTRIVGFEIENGTVLVSGKSFSPATGVFTDDSVALVQLPSCG